MEKFKEIIICLGILLTHSVQGHMFLARHREAIESYIMTGYGKGWRSCDVISDTPQGPAFLEGNPHFVMKAVDLKNFDISTTLASSHCLLASYYVRSNTSLSALIEFGWTVVQHKRLALVLKMGPGINLVMATNTTKLPFVVAAELWDGTSQFLCPVVGEREPRLQDSTCDASLKGKAIRVTYFGVPPYLYGKMAKITLFSGLKIKTSY